MSAGHGGPLKLLPLVVLTLALAGCDRQAPRLKLVAGALRVDQDTAGALAGLMADDPVVAIDLSPTALEGDAALDALDAGEADLALVENSLNFRPTIRTVLPLYSSILHIAYRRGHAATDGRALLDGARVFAGAPGSPARAMLERIVVGLGLTNDDFSLVADLNAEPDVIVVFAPFSPERISQLGDYELYSLGTPQMIGEGSTVDAVSLLFPQLRPFVIPQGAYGDKTQRPIVTVAVDTVLVSSERLEPAVAHDLVERLLELRAAIAAQRPGLFRSMSADFDAQSLTFALHAGTRAYRQRDAPTIYERFAGVVEVALTVLLATLSATFAGLRFVKFRRKNRIDRFYGEVLAIRTAMDEPLSADQRQGLSQRLRALENEAFEQLIRERLAPDESFRIFISLASEVRQELAAGHSAAS